MWRGILLILGIAAIGCADSPSGGKPLPTTVPASGVVTLNGKPLASAGVMFYPQTAGSGVECFGYTDDAGKFTLTQLRGQGGAPPGEYRVTVSQYLKKDGTPFKNDGTVAPADADANESLPPKYSSASETILKATVVEGAEVKIDLTKP